jgi:hypothetical protein
MFKLIFKLFSFFFIAFGAISIFSSTDVQAAGQYTLSPQTGTFYVGRRFETLVTITTDQATTAADVKIGYDSCKLEVEDANNSVAGTQIFPGTIYNNYPNVGNSVTTTGCSGLIKLTGFTSDPDGVLQSGGSGIFGKIRFKVRDVDLTGSIVDIQTSGFGPTFTLDSNISNTAGLDMLTAATDGNYVLRVDNDPVPDSDDRPFFDQLNPGLNASTIPINSNILFRANDNESGVDVNTLTASITVNGGAPTVYTSSSTQITSVCTTSNYDAVPTCSYTFNPSQNFPYDALVCTTLAVGDLARTTINYTNISNTSVPYTSCFRTEYDLNKPFTTANIPGKNSTNISVTTPVTFTLEDNETGADIDSLIITIGGVDYTKTGANQFTFTGTSSSYNITVPTLPAFIEDQTVTVRIRAQDFATQLGISTPNQLDETFTFKLSDTQKPFVDQRSPEAGVAFVSSALPITFHLKDISAGVDMNTVRVFVSGLGELTQSGFSFTGTPNDYTITITSPPGGWPVNSPIAVAVYAMDISGNYLDADVWAIGSGGIARVTDTIVREIEKIIEVPKTIRDVQYLTVEQIIQAIEKDKGVSLPEEVKTLIRTGAQEELDKLYEVAASVSLKKINNNDLANKFYWTWEGTEMSVEGVGSPNSIFIVSIPESLTSIEVSTDSNGTWKGKIPARLLGYHDYKLIARSVVGGEVVGESFEIGMVRVVPYWWIPATITVTCLAYSLTLYNKKRIDRLNKIIEELSQKKNTKQTKK